MALIPFTNEVLTLVLATLVIELMSALFAPAKDAVLPSIVPRSDLVAANQVNLLTTYGTLPLGAAVYSGSWRSRLDGAGGQLPGRSAAGGADLVQRAVVLPRRAADAAAAPPGSARRVAPGHR
jgi:hypothetical protein